MNMYQVKFTHINNDGYLRNASVIKPANNAEEAKKIVLEYVKDRHRYVHITRVAIYDTQMELPLTNKK